jgi:hypothetical protein
MRTPFSMDQPGEFMRRFGSYLSMVFALASTTGLAADVNVRVLVQGEVAPGVYGRVEIGGSPPPLVVYPEPVIIRPVPPLRAQPQPQPIYLHVPPGHAKKWGKHCHKYNACGQPVYFVKSAEYEPKKPKKEKKEKAG